MKKIVTISITIILLGAIGLAFYAYKKINSPAITKKTIIYVNSNSSLEDLVELIKPNINDINTFEQIAKLKQFDKPVAGKFTLSKGLSYNKLINKLRRRGESIKIRFNNQDRLENLAGRLAQQIEADSISFLKAMKDQKFLNETGFNKDDAIAMYIPNQYEAYWNTTPKAFCKKMLHYYKKFWNKKRLAQAKQLNLTPKQVSVLASVVQKETSQISERPIVAGLYLNRYKVKHRLQADPTVIFAMKQKYGHNKVYKRVLKKDLAIDSPYNTYTNIGLPPAPISMPDISSIDAVLNPTKHEYFFMCASTERIGFHEFTKNLTQHNRNAEKYRKWISKKGIKR